MDGEYDGGGCKRGVTKERHETKRASKDYSSYVAGKRHCSGLRSSLLADQSRLANNHLYPYLDTSDHFLHHLYWVLMRCRVSSWCWTYSAG